MYYKGKKLERPTSPGTDFHGYGNTIRSELAKRIPRKRSLKVLDVGTGFGSTASFLAKHLQKPSRIWTVDPSQEILDNAKANLASERNAFTVSIEFVRADAGKMKFENDFFDVVVSVMVLHHLVDVSIVLKELSKVLKNKGRLLLADYKPEAGRELEFQQRHQVKEFFKPSLISRLIEKDGFSKVKLEDFELWYLIDAIK